MKRAALIMLLQLAVSFALSLLTFLLRPIAWIYKASIWALIPLYCGCSAFFAARKGLNPYLSCLMPWIGFALASLVASMGYLPNGGATLLCALLSLVGAAAGEVYNRRKINNSYEKRRNHKRR